MWSVFIFSFSNITPMPKLFNSRTYSRQYAVFRAKRLIDFMITRSIFFFLHIQIIRLNSVRFLVWVPFMPSSANISARVHSFFLVYKVSVVCYLYLVAVELFLQIGKYTAVCRYTDLMILVTGFPVCGFAGMYVTLGAAFIDFTSFCCVFDFHAIYEFYLYDTSMTYPYP